MAANGMHERGQDERLRGLLGLTKNKAEAAVTVGTLERRVLDILKRVEAQKAAGEAVTTDDLAAGDRVTSFRDPEMKSGFFTWALNTLWKPPAGTAGPALRMRRNANAAAWLAAATWGGRGNNEPRLWAMGSSNDPGDFGPWREMYHEGNIVGPVASNTDGIPQGAIIETGANANGRYVKFADGTMLCSWGGHAGLAATGGGPTIYTSADGTWTFPAPFSTTDDLFCSATFFTGQSWGYGGSLAPTVTSMTFRRAALASSAGLASPRLFASGRWG